MNDSKCPFCGSENRVVETPYYDRAGNPQTSYCCEATKRNLKYVKSNNPDPDLQPDLDTIEKW